MIYPLRNVPKKHYGPVDVADVLDFTSDTVPGKFEYNISASQMLALQVGKLLDTPFATRI